MRALCARAKRCGVVLAGLVLAVALASPVLAHEHRVVAGMTFVVGFRVEPAYEGELNGATVRVTRPAPAASTVPGAAAAPAAQPVEGLEKTLKVEITFVPTGVKTNYDLRTVFRDPGLYVADFIPTAPGTYRFRFFGSVNSVPVDETFISGDDFDDVMPVRELQFPDRLPGAREVAAVATAAQDTAANVGAAASTARTLGVIGIGLGAVGALLGAGALVMVARVRRT
ncbi:MAG: hypothetical protein FJ029_07770 [Actinobacteria bacterium]|nr:hypothetical protein [Actinomycetota bacterium]